MLICCIKERYRSALAVVFQGMFRREGKAVGVLMKGLPGQW